MMNLIDDEPRKVPKPIPYSQESAFQPTVPEVSLILQETSKSQNPIRNESFSGTEFQTYNAWRWKNMKESGKGNQITEDIRQIKTVDYFPICDKFSGSDIEKRKNEILYGKSEEPRRPLPPRPPIIIPKCVEASFSDASFNDEQAGNLYKNRNIASGLQNIRLNDSEDVSSFKSCGDIKRKNDGIGEKLNESGSLYQIIAEQSKQLLLLQKQIEQLVRSQETKDKQVEQLLKSQEMKQSKIEQLLEMQVLKENQIEQLLLVQEKSDKQIEQLIQSQEIWEKNKFDLLEQLKNSKKEVVNIGIMTDIQLVDAATNTNANDVSQKEINGTSNFSVEQSPVERNSSRFGVKEKSFTLHSLDLPIIQEQVPTPLSSIHVDIPEYNASSDEESSDSSSESREIQIHEPFSKPLGYTFYNNVLTQVKDIIENNEDKENKEVSFGSKHALDVVKSNKWQNPCSKENKMKMLHSPVNMKNPADQIWGVNHEYAHDCTQPPITSCNNSKNDMNPTVQSKYEYGYKDSRSPSDVSLKMNALALKYLKQEQISDYDIQPQLQPNYRQPDVTIYNVTNLSFSTMRYLERHRLSAGDRFRTNVGNSSPQHFLQQRAKAGMRNFAE